MCCGKTSLINVFCLFCNIASISSGGEIKQKTSGHRHGAFPLRLMSKATSDSPRTGEETGVISLCLRVLSFTLWLEGGGLRRDGKEGEMSLEVARPTFTVITPHVIPSHILQAVESAASAAHPRAS